jgi:hypothetical protein
MPAKAGIQESFAECKHAWTPACAGVTKPIPQRL